MCDLFRLKKRKRHPCSPIQWDSLSLKISAPINRKPRSYFFSEASVPPTDQLSCGIGSNTTHMYSLGILVALWTTSVIPWAISVRDSFVWGKLVTRTNGILSPPFEKLFLDRLFPLFALLHEFENDSIRIAEIAPLPLIFPGFQVTVDCGMKFNARRF